MENIEILEIDDLKPSKRSKKKRQPKGFWGKYGYLLFFPISLIFKELIFNIFVYPDSWSDAAILRTILYFILFGISAGAIAGLVTSLFGRKANRAIGIILSVFMFLLFGTQLVYYTFFLQPLTLNSVGGAEQAMDFISIIFDIIFKKLYVIILLFLPTLFLIIFGNRFFSSERRPMKQIFSIIAVVVVFHLLGLGAVALTKEDPMGPFNYYHKVYDVSSTQRIFGVYTNFRLDLKKMIFGFEEKIDIDTPTVIDDTTKPTEPTSEGETTEPPKEYGYNVMDIDFESLIANEKDEEVKAMHEYFSKRQPTKQNEHTGMFKDCNLIVLCCESFTTYAMDEKLTPMLYKLATEGFEFKNYYNPIWWTSTTDGEYTASVGLVPKGGVWSHKASASNYLPFCLGNQFDKIGYSVYAYHNHTYTFYGRDVSFPAMGYKNYKALGHGLEVAKYWPESDVEMMEKTVEEYVHDDHFHTYYMTVSGHAAYTYIGNYQASKNKEYVKDLGYSLGPSAYLACNLELEFALEYLINALDEAGKLDNTVIVMYGDHYPYALTLDEISELLGHQVDEKFELYKSTLIIWKNGMEHEVVEKPTMSIDIVPTISNLFGLEYDSRLMMGHDIFSDEPGLVMLSNRSWITDKAMYDVATKKVTNLTDGVVTQEYVDTVNAMVKERFVYSVKILDKDYWGKVFKKK